MMLLRYGLPVNFQAMLLAPQKKSQKRLREVLNHLYGHLDNSAATPAGADVSFSTLVNYPSVLNTYKVHFKAKLCFNLM